MKAQFRVGKTLGLKGKRLPQGYEAEGLEMRKIVQSYKA